MNNNFEFVYCIDRKYNKQAFLSICSLFENCNIKNLSVNIIHKTPLSFYRYRRKLKILFPELNLKIIGFKFDIKGYPKLKNSHVSEATYYRIFIADHLPKNTNFIVYIDADAFILNNPLPEIQNSINCMIKDEKYLGARTTDVFSKSESLDIFNRLNINDKYFNAGILIINLNMWREKNITNLLKDKVQKLEDKIVYWDQDVLNSLVNGEYFELSENLNFIQNLNHRETFYKSKIKIIHYVGSLKPWSKEGIKINPHTYYQFLYKKYLN